MATVNRGLTASQRKAYLDHHLTHSEYYMWIAECLGINALRRFIPVSLEIVKEKLAEDENLNNISLRQWDAQDANVRRFAGYAGFPSWSLSDTVCTLKELARAEARTK